MKETYDTARREKLVNGNGKLMIKLEERNLKQHETKPAINVKK